MSGQKGRIHFHPGNGTTSSRRLCISQKQADPHTDVDYPGGESFTLNGKEYSVVYLNDPANPEYVFFRIPDYAGGAFSETVARGQTLTLHVRFLIPRVKCPLPG